MDSKRISNIKIISKDSEQKYNIKSKKLDILIVDDDYDTRNSLKDLIEMRNHNVSDLEEGMRCVSRCNKKKYDIIFMDYHMNDLKSDIGEVNGLDVVKIMKECCNNDAPIFAYTGDNSSDAIKKFKESDLTGVLIKPVSPKLINDFFSIFEEYKDENYKKKLKKISIKNKNLMIFKK